jgi:hypothetical protein
VAIPIKLLITWDIAAEQEEQCLALVVRELPLALNREGLDYAAWFTAYGEWPQIRVELIAEDLDALEKFLASETWSWLRQKVKALAQGYKEKVLIARGGYQL